MTPVIVDFETYYSKKDGVSVVDQGNANYVRTADAYIGAISIGGEVLCGTIPELGDVAEQIAKDPNVQCYAANSEFDRSWWNKYYPPTVQMDWKCILDIGRGCQMGTNVANLAKQVLGETMDKNTRDEMNGVDYFTLTPERQLEVQTYCLNDVQYENRLLTTMPPLTPMEDRIAAHTRLINRRGVNINEELVDHDKTHLEKLHHEMLSRIPWVRSGEKPLSAEGLRDWCNFNGIPVPKSTAKTDEDCADLMSEHPILNEMLGVLRVYRKANTLLEKLATLQRRLTNEGVMPLDIIYCGAPHTKRYSSKGFNIQNLDKKPMKVTDDLTVWTRNWIVPPPGCMFLILDFAQVEPRCLNWLVGNHDMMAALREGFSYYEAYAAFARGWKGAPGTLKDEYGVVKYTLLKNECLGLGYGMGVKKFINYAAQNGQTVTAVQAKPIVDGFRARNPKITTLWSELGSLVISAARDKSKQLELTMPNGDLMRYFHVKLYGGGTSGKPNYAASKLKGIFSKEGMVYNLWGGSMTENVTQRMARDVMAEACVRLEDNGFPVMFHSHDEVILAVQKTDDPVLRKEIKAEASRVMKQAPEWCLDLPLGVDGGFSDCYTKL